MNYRFTDSAGDELRIYDVRKHGSVVVAIIPSDNPAETIIMPRSELRRLRDSLSEMLDDENTKETSP